MSGRTVGTTPRRGALVALLVAGLVVVPALVAMTVGAPQSGSTRSRQSDDASRCLVVGAAVNAPERVDADAQSLFRKAAAALGPLTVRRSFDSGLPRTFAESAAAGDEAAGIRSFVSWKPPNGDHRGAAAGAYDAQIRAWAKSVPRTGVYATSFHEPEDDMTGAEFVAFQRHVYTVVKAANPTIRWGPVYMAYWWDPTSPSHFVGDPAQWWPGDGYADFAGLDWYGPDPQPMTGSRSFRFWYRSMASAGVPLLISEYGQYAVAAGDRRQPAKEEERAAAITVDAAWIDAHPRIQMWLYWQAVGAQGDWRLRDEASQRAWRAVAEAGCRPE